MQEHPVFNHCFHSCSGLLSAGRKYLLVFILPLLRHFFHQALKGLLTNNFCHAQGLSTNKDCQGLSSCLTDRLPTKIKCKIHASFILTKFYKTQLARYLVLIQPIQSVTKFYLLIADKKLTTVFPLLFRDARAWAALLSNELMLFMFFWKIMS